MSQAARALACLAVLGVCGACVLDSTPGIRDCQPIAWRYLRFGPSSGALDIVPSAVADVTIDSAGWRTTAYTYDIGAAQGLVLAARLRWTRPIVPGALAVIYRGSAGMTPIVDDGLRSEEDEPDMIDLSEGPTAAKARVDARVRRREAALAARAVSVEWHGTYREGLASGFTMPFNGCPRSAQLVRKQALATYLVPDRLLALRASLARAPQASGGPRLTARVSWDSLIDAGGLGLYRTTIGFVVNPTDTVLPDARVALVPEPRVLYSDRGTPRGQAPPDTIWLPIGDLPARSVVPFAGGGLETNRRVIGRHVISGSARP